MSSGQAIARALRGVHLIESLQLQDCNLTSLGMRSLSLISEGDSKTRPVSHRRMSRKIGVVLPALQTARDPKKVLRLNLSGNPIGDHIIISLRDQLHQLQHFNISDNCIGEKGATALAAAIRHHLRSLKSLHANRCSLNGSGFSEIVSSLHPDGPPLHTLHLAHNIERPDASRPCRELALLVSRTAIVDLGVGYNAFKMHSLIDISEAIMHSTTLQTLDMEGIDLSRVINNFALAFQRSISLQRWD